MDPVAPNLKFLMRMSLSVGGVLDAGQTPGGARRVARVTGGSFTAEGFSGDVQAGEDWILERGDGSILLDVRLPLVTDQGETILMRYGGVRAGSPEIMAALARGEGSCPPIIISASPPPSRRRHRVSPGSTASSPSAPASA